jgi:glycerol uptake facilitator-like aquaporin
VLRPGLLRVTEAHVGLPRRLVAEGLGTALLLTAVVGSGIMGDRLSGGVAGLALLANTVATGATLVVLILAFGPLSGAHFNPVVSLCAATRGSFAWKDVASYAAAQILGALAGVWLAHTMFAEPLWQVSTHARSGLPQVVSEFVATFGLLFVIWSCERTRPGVVPFAVGLYITGAYWFTASTSFANPAVTIARSVTNTFAGIRPLDVLPFIGAQVVGALSAAALHEWLTATTNPAHDAESSQLPQPRAAALRNRP